jgi:hypothetical protein
MFWILRSAPHIGNHLPRFFEASERGPRQHSIVAPSLIPREGTQNTAAMVPLAGRLKSSLSPSLHFVLDSPGRAPHIDGHHHFFPEASRSRHVTFDRWKRDRNAASIGLAYSAFLEIQNMANVASFRARAAQAFPSAGILRCSEGRHGHSQLLE